MQVRFTGFVSVGVALCALALAGCQGKEPPAAAAEAVSPQPLPAGRVRVQPASLKFMEIRAISAAAEARQVWAPARVAFREDRVSEVAAPVAGRIVAVQAQVGDTVKAGAPLATIASPDASRIRAELSNAEVELRVAETEARRQQTMVDKGVGVEAELVAAQARLQQARQNLNAASRAAGYLGAGGNDGLVLRAPRDGVVVARTALPGAAVGTESGALFTIGDPSALWVTADVFESDVAAIHPGAAVKVTVPSLAEPLAGKVARVSSALDAQTRRAQVFIALDQGNAGLRAGMLARAGIETRDADGLSIPINAVLIKDGDHSIVFVQVEDTVFEARTVQLGPPSNGYIPVLGGLAPGDKVVVKGALLLDGAANQLL
ncbi:hypothetical protein GCM10023144_37950 [Pigmentiphaga soli]|uniref:Efflux RND transporter periplasmic adaptor subunit n=1 Tax=Pigmentiphaga soli TaxID=1007095 RepID=A0ABP8HI99_9BURK